MAERTAAVQVEVVTLMTAGATPGDLANVHAAMSEASQRLLALNDPLDTCAGRRLHDVLCMTAQHGLLRFDTQRRTAFEEDHGRSSPAANRSVEGVGPFIIQACPPPLVRDADL